MAPGKGKTTSLRKKQKHRKQGKRRIDDELSQMRNPDAGRSLPGVRLPSEPAHKKNHKGIDHIIICNKFGIVNNNNETINSNNKEIEKIFGEEFENESKESLIIFKNGKDENDKDNYYSDINNDFMYKWYVLLQYFVERNKNKENEEENKN